MNAHITKSQLESYLASAKSPRPARVTGQGHLSFHRRCIVVAYRLAVGFRPMACRKYRCFWQATGGATEATAHRFRR
jgi:hypothetical protein